MVYFRFNHHEKIIIIRDIILSVNHCIVLNRKFEFNKMLFDKQIFIVKFTISFYYNLVKLFYLLFYKCIRF